MNESLVNLTKFKKLPPDECFINAYQDLKEINLEEDTGNNKTSYLFYAFRIILAGIYAQGLLSKDDLINIGWQEEITDNQNDDFKKVSLTEALKWLSKYHPISIQTAQKLIYAANKDLNLKDFLGIEEAIDFKSCITFFESDVLDIKFDKTSFQKSIHSFIQLNSNKKSKSKIFNYNISEGKDNPLRYKKYVNAIGIIVIVSVLIASFLQFMNFKHLPKNEDSDHLTENKIVSTPAENFQIEPLELGGNTPSYPDFGLLTDDEIIKYLYGLQDLNELEALLQALDAKKMNQIAKSILKSDYHEKYNIAQLLLINAVLKDESNVEYLDNLAYSSILIQDLNVAKTALNKAVQLQQNRPDTILHLARYHALDNDLTSCQSSLKQYAQIIENSSKTLKIFSGISTNKRDSKQFKDCISMVMNELKSALPQPNRYINGKDLEEQMITKNFIREVEAQFDEFKFALNSKEVTMFDINNDGIPDKIVQLSICEESRCNRSTVVTQIAILVGIGKDKYRLADSQTFGIGANINSITPSGELNVEAYGYGNNDPTCCPSIVEKLKYAFRNEKLVLMN